MRAQGRDGAMNAIDAFGKALGIDIVAERVPAQG